MVNQEMGTGRRSARGGTSRVPHVVIVGGGIAGLSAAFLLRDEPVRLTVCEESSRLGGQLAVSEVAGVAVDEGAEAVWRPKTEWLIGQTALGDRLVSADNAAVATWTRGGMWPLPDGHFMSVPSDLDALARSGVLTDEGVARAREDRELPATPRNGDVSVGEYVAARFGQEVVDRLVDPFVHEMCAGRAAELSFEGTLPPLAMASRKRPSLADAAGMLVPSPGSGVPELHSGLGTLVGGMGALPGALADAVLADSPGAALRTGTRVTGLARDGHGWRLTADSAAGREEIAADAVILAVPAGPAGGLLAGLPDTGAACTGLAEIPYASAVMITLAYPRGTFRGGPAERGLAGYRVPAVDGRTVRSVTFSSVKWRHMAGDVEIVRCQAGGVDARDLLERDDADLAALAAGELAEATGASGEPVATRVSRWDRALPQYTVGHPARSKRIRGGLAGQPGLAVCGAAYEGVGIGQCMNTGRKAAQQVLTHLDTAAGARGA
ncbi:protoporphyrinogen oxidase [Actinomadura livida]|uniref:Coproporphyrinogen III oxidase n=1 Tax=Actinomadura livida TaxID=79909 RepID=A0A7W7IFC1_9ACTN|nr:MULTISPECIES: protoporphyrinogen oxidase [Actinomadura]MBB4776042.1 oxygen-dependent protoporphyrinogen oxidase [Actinomadura catellatispora]GGU15890.1 protoporphyrinogen oxidase [Actinomadura livida]